MNWTRSSGRTVNVIRFHFVEFLISYDDDDDDDGTNGKLEYITLNHKLDLSSAINSIFANINATFLIWNRSISKLWRNSLGHLDTRQKKNRFQQMTLILAVQPPLWRHIYDKVSR